MPMAQGDKSGKAFPWNVIVPWSTVSRRLTHRRSVDFPLPDGPKSAAMPPWGMSNEILFNTKLLLNDLERFFALSMAQFSLQGFSEDADDHDHYVIPGGSNQVGFKEKVFF